MELWNNDNDNSEKSLLLQDIMAQAREILLTYKAGLAGSNLYHYLNTYADPAHFSDFIGRCRENIEGELNGTSDDLDARLVKQSQSLDCLYDYLLLRSQTMEDMGEHDKEFRHIDMALKAQSQSARTIEKFRRLREKRVKNAEQTSKNTERTSKDGRHAPLD